MGSLLLADATGLSAEGDCTDTSKTTACRLFDTFVCRVAGLPVRYMEQLRAAKTVELFEDLVFIEERMAKLGDDLVDRLHPVVGQIDERKIRGKLLRIKRDVHNRRHLVESHLVVVAERLPLALVADLQDYREMALRRRALKERLEETFGDEVAACRRRFQTFVEDEDFQKGLLLSSQPLFESLERYAGATVATLGAKQRQIERGLMRYFSRMVMKTSPFATFTAIVEGRFTGVPATESAAGGFSFVGDPRRKRSLVRLNKGIYGVLQRELLTNATIRDGIPVELNPSLRRLGDQWQFLAAKGVGETFQRVPCHPVLDLFKGVLDGGEEWTFSSLRRRVSEQVEAAADELHGFTDHLLDIGFLRFRFGIGEQEVEWARLLEERLATIDDPEARKVMILLDALRRGGEDYTEASVHGRRRALAQATRHIAESYASLTERRALRTDVPFYEDAGAEARLEVCEDDIDGLREVLADYVRLTSKLAWPRHDHASMRHFFDTFYDDEGQEAATSDVHGGPSIPLLQFYEDYYREHLKDHLRKEQLLARGLPIDGSADDGSADDEPSAGDSQEGGSQAGDSQEDGPPNNSFDELNPFDLEIVEGIRLANDGLTRLLRQRWRQHPEAEQIDFTRDELASAVDGIPAAHNPCLSLSIFVQLLPGLAPDGGPALLTSNYLKGFGKYFSRFLDVLPEPVQEAVVDNNRQLTDAWLAEICGDGNFNANLHPPLVDHEVSYPTAEGSATEGRLMTSDLQVERSPGDDHALALRHGPSGQRVIPLDLGFQNPKMRPPLYQLLSSFSPACNYFLQVPELAVTWDEVDDAAQEAGAHIPPVAHRPRIAFAGRLVLARRRWAVRADVYPRRQVRESESEFFLRANRWRREHGIPREVFLSIRALPVPQKADDADDRGAKAKRMRRNRARRDRVHKPQYIDFDNPLLVDLLGRATENLDAFQAFFYERLPGRQHLARHGEEAYVTEMVIQMDLPEHSEPAVDAEVDATTGGAE